MTNEEAIHKLEYSKKAYQMLIDEKVDSGKFVGKDVEGEWKADTPLDEAYKSMIEALDVAIKALEQTELNSSYNGVNTELDCISREAVEKITWEEPSYTDALNVLTEVREKVRALPSVTPKAEWIPCTERLPEDYIHVLCQFTLGGMGECYLAHGVFHLVGGLIMTCNEVMAWMPLPEPYKAESEDEE